MGGQARDDGFGPPVARLHVLEREGSAEGERAECGACFCCDARVVDDDPRAQEPKQGMAIALHNGASTPCCVNLLVEMDSGFRVVREVGEHERLSCRSCLVVRTRERRVELEVALQLQRDVRGVLSLDGLEPPVFHPSVVRLVEVPNAMRANLDLALLRLDADILLGRRPAATM
eukprot:2551084-Prymnesium_polylepis.1